MINLRTWWRSLGSSKAFFLAVALLFAPVAEAFACAPEAPVAATEQQAGVVTPTDNGDAHQNAQDEICQHGHCHHGGSLIAPELTEVSVQAASSDQNALPTCGLLMSRTTSRLERPPRA
ncbi:hypothetical protein [Phenylobacterium sp.]|uniref:hypothetical protein n=1 Tax=Phenylobacterium sp. TaxID=1871053 RepID=UPI003BA93B9D